MTYRLNNDRMVRCDYCFKFPHIVKQYVSKRPPAIICEKGTRFYEKIFSEHLSSAYHQECTKAYRLSTIGDEQEAPMEIAINKAIKHQIDYVGKLMIPIYMDAKRLNDSAHSWPSRYVAAECSKVYNPHDKSGKIVPSNINVQYVNPSGHLNLMTAIVQSHRPELLRKINECLALSLRIDGSIDFTHVDKIYVLGEFFVTNDTNHMLRTNFFIFQVN